MLSSHVRVRMQQRGISEKAIEMTIVFGRLLYAKGAQTYVLGRKEVDYYRQEGVDLTAFEGIHVVTTKEKVILTSYRNRLLKHLRPSRDSRTGRKPKRYRREREIIAA